MSLASEMVEGSICSVCQMPFTKDHGYPVACAECWEYTLSAKRFGLQKAVYPVMTGEQTDTQEIR